MKIIKTSDGGVIFTLSIKNNEIGAVTVTDITLSKATFDGMKEFFNNDKAVYDIEFETATITNN